jgi:light-regulated signal transduction histidine kinase (bacteriophytochrome)
MGDLIDDLLAFSKLGRSEISKTTIDTDEMVREVISGLDAGHAVKWNVAPLPHIKGDANAIRQVWINLISNAIKYSRNEEQPVINIGLAHQNGQMAFFVEDNGVGFDQKYAGKLFKVFQRLHAANEFEGTGIGLAIIEKVVSKHGGKVWVEAEKDRGAKFFFEIPTA